MPPLRGRRCPSFHFSLTDKPGVDHFSLPSNATVLAQLIADVARSRTDCS